jgi:hypothetical protein
MREKKITPVVRVKIRVKTFAHEPKRKLRFKCMALSACMALIKGFLPADGMLGSVCQWLRGRLDIAGGGFGISPPVDLV